MEKIKTIFKLWLPLAAAVTAMCGLVFLAVQQDLRQGANDPQIQIAEDAAAAMENGAPLNSIVPAGKTAIESSLATFVMIFDDTGAVVGSSAALHGETPQLPPGILDFVRTHGQDRVTWQPESGVRIAAVIVRSQGSQPGFVLAGRSLREVEIREGNAELIAGAAWISTLAATLVVCVLAEWILGSKRSIT